MRAYLLTAVVVLAMVATPVAADHQDNWEYTPPEGASMESLTGAYNANLDQVPRFFRGILPSGDDAVILVFVYEHDDLSVNFTEFEKGGGNDQMSLYSLSLDSDGEVVDIEEIPPLIEWQRGLDRYDRLAFSVSASDMDAIIMASDPAAVAQTLYDDGQIDIQSAGNIRRAIVLLVYDFMNPDWWK